MAACTYPDCGGGRLMKSKRKAKCMCRCDFTKAEMAEIQKRKMEAKDNA